MKEAFSSVDVKICPRGAGLFVNEGGDAISR
jgi:hypothetical protein